MNWIGALYSTYERNAESIGKLESLSYGKDNKESRPITPLFPVFHSSQHAHLTLVLGKNGELRKVLVNEAMDTQTIIPVTESSGARTSGLSPHPLCDKIQYVAGDFLEYASKKGSSGYKEYVELLEKWSLFDPEEQMLSAVLAYVKKGQMIRDLVDRKIVALDGEGKLMLKWKGDKKDTPELFKILGASDQEGTFVRWAVQIPGRMETKVWKDKKIWDSWARFVESEGSSLGLCYVTGKTAPLAALHPSKVRNAGDGAKLISSNDKDGYTFRGRFIEAGQVCGVSCEVSQKAHSALRWLISRQGWSDGSLVIVAWATWDVVLPDPCQDTSRLAGLSPPEDKKEGMVNYTASEMGLRLKKKIDGYQAEMSPQDHVYVISLDSASPGRLAVTYFNELSASRYWENIEHWHTECIWSQWGVGGMQFEGAPSIRSIIEAAYGSNVDEKVRRQTAARLLPCIIDRKPIPRDLEQTCVNRATSRPSFKEWYEWEKVLRIACALYRYQQNTENNKQLYTMDLDSEIKTRDYLYGRLLAVADKIEREAMKFSQENRPTNAEKLMNRFAMTPFKTWPILHKAIDPYQKILEKKSPGLNNFLKDCLSEIHKNFKSEDFRNDGKLSGEFLLGYYCQRSDFYKKKETSPDKETNETQPE